MYLKEFERWAAEPSLREAAKAELEAMRGSDEKIKENFGATLKFGTAGLRGIMEQGCNKMNVHTVRKASQGLADYLTAAFDEPSVVVSYDSRLNSRVFAEETAAVLTANGVKTYIFEQMMPVPVLSFAVRRLKASAGVMITASHNPKAYNGYKVYNSTGGQILDEEAGKILAEIEKLDIFDDVKTMDFDEALKKGCSLTPAYAYEDYMAEMEEASDVSREREIGIVYTPLNGSGRKPVQETLTRSGFSFFTVPEQEEEDGNFTTCPYPNPEKAEVYEIAEKYAKEQAADIILATDPDCDRVGLMAKHGEEYVLFSGNEVGGLLFNFICQLEGENAAGKKLFTSMVSTPLVDRIAENYGVKVERTLVGFKYIGDKIENNQKEFIFGFEESNGYLVGTYARDKDGVAAARLICQMAAYYKSKGKTLVDVLEDIYQETGYVADKTVTLEISSQDESREMMKKLRDMDRVNEAMENISGYRDYADPASCTGLPYADIVQMDFADKSRVIVRPSGTEPKIKIYLSSCCSEMELCHRRNDEIMGKIAELIK